LEGGIFLPGPALKEGAKPRWKVSLGMMMVLY
jgi:hypothetical protein